MIIDVSAALGDWPFRKLPHTGPEAAARRYEAAGIDYAVMSDNRAVLAVNPHEFNLDFIEQLKAFPQFLPAAVISPAMPGWKAHIDRCRDAGARAVKLYPNYHAYPLNLPQLQELLAYCGEIDMPVIVMMQVEDPRTHHPLMKVPDVDHRNLSILLEGFDGTRVIVANLGFRQTAQSGVWYKYCPRVSICTSQFDYVRDMDELLENWDLRRVVFGTNYPFFYLECGLAKISGFSLDDEKKQAILEENAREIFNI